MERFTQILAGLVIVSKLLVVAAGNEGRLLDAMIQPPLCTPPNGTFEIEVLYTGDDINGFNIATTAIGKDADTPEVYHLNLVTSELNQIVRRQGCFERNSLQRFVVYQEKPTRSKPPGTYYSLFVNGKLIAHEEDPSDAVFTEYYFMGDQEDCAAGDLRFTLEVLFDLWPDENTWQLSQLTDCEDVINGYQVILNFENTLKAGTSFYTSEFRKTMLFVDHCIEQGSFKFEFKDSGRDKIDAPGYYELAIDGSSIRSGPNAYFLETTEFIHDGNDIIFEPTSAPVFIPPPTSIKIPTPKPDGPIPRTSAPEPPPVLIPFCFSASTTVQVRDKGQIEMQQLKIGDMIAVGENGVFEPVYSFGHYQPNGHAEFLEIHTNHSTVPALQVSNHHLIFVVKESRTIAVPAAAVRVGDNLMFYGNGYFSVALVESVVPVMVDDGLYAPFTPSGKFLANGGLLVSSFVAFDDALSSLKVGGVGFSYQWMAHAFEFPHRVACYYAGQCPKEMYNEVGISTWVAAPADIALSILAIETPALKEFLLVIVLCGMFMFSFLEFFFHRIWLIGSTIFFLRCLNASPHTHKI